MRPSEGPTGQMVFRAAGSSCYVLDMAVSFLRITAKQRGDATMQCDGCGETMLPETIIKLRIPEQSSR